MLPGFPFHAGMSGQRARPGLISEASAPTRCENPIRGARGADIKRVRSDRIRWKPIEVSYASICSEPFHQEFIYTGAHPEVHRVGTFVAEPIYSFKVNGDTRTLPLPGRLELRHTRGIGPPSIVANARSSTYSDCFDADIVELAKRAHAAFPDVPLLGVDLLRDAETGKLWVIEVNASGYTWHASLPVGRVIQATHNLDFKAQFGGLERVAQILAERLNREPPEASA